MCIYKYVYIKVYRICMYKYVYINIYIKKTNFNVCERCEHQKAHIFFIQIYFGIAFLHQCICVCV